EVAVRAKPVADVGDGLRAHGYFADLPLATAVFLAVRMGQPLFLEGDAGVGKTDLARVLAELLDTRLIRLQCYEGIDASQALYEWNYARQLLHIRAAEAAAVPDVAALERSAYTREFLIARPLLQALEHDGPRPAVLLIDEIDRADDEFEAFLLELLSEFAISIPELGRIEARRRPLVILTSNRTREVHDALKRRCLYHWLEHPTREREIAILRHKLPGLDARLAERVALALERLRRLELFKPPGVAEALDWGRALQVLGVAELDEAAAGATLGTVLKYREDQERARAEGLGGLIGAAGD
ncbi:MAG TPA: MoxR family ATPase, partial [Candidatus Baltobacteraceae bacterium]|nr:MoxR family ATPase [Candidatus Baltobacteraceae bacterium]